MFTLQNLGALSIIILAIGLTIIPLVWPHDARSTFSQHVARHKSSIAYYILLFSIFLPLFLLFFLGWFVPHFDMPGYIVALVWIVALTQYACTLIPETNGRKVFWHRLLAGLSAFALIPITSYFILSPSIYVQIAAAVGVFGMIALSVLFLNPRSKFGESFYIQVIYYTLFFLPILFQTYIA